MDEKSDLDGSDRRGRGDAVRVVFDLEAHPDGPEDLSAFSIHNDAVDSRSEAFAEGVAYDLSGGVPTGVRRGGRYQIPNRGVRSQATSLRRRQWRFQGVLESSGELEWSSSGP